MHTIASANVLKKITCFRNQKFSLNQFKLLASTGLSYRWTSRRSLFMGFFQCISSDGTLKWNPATIHHDLINCSQNTRLNFVILGLSLESSHGRPFTKNHKKRTYNNAEKP